MNTTQEITCPECNATISIDDVLTQQIEERIKKELRAETQKKEKAVADAEQALETQRVSFEKEKKQAAAEMEKQVQERIEAERQVLRAEARKEAEKHTETEKKLLEEQLREKDERINAAEQKELEVRREKVKLEEDRRSFEIDMQRKLDDERRMIMNDAAKKAGEDSQYEIAQLKKQIADATKANGELKRKLEQGSQQTQGEVLELALEEVLKEAFPFDEIDPVPKGVSGADVTQTVRDRNGSECGTIIWESKKTKAWSEGWIQKLKDDQRKVRADIAVIVSTTMPNGVSGFELRDGVWVCEVSLATALASALRSSMEALTTERRMSVGKNEKVELLYGYLTGTEFKQRVEAIVEGFVGMRGGLQKERLAYEKIWSEREKQIQKVIVNTAGMYGDLSGLVALQKIPTLELGPAGGDDNSENNEK